MSSLTQCNRCKLVDIRGRAVSSALIVTLQDSAHGGVDVLVHPPDEAPDRMRHFVAWFMALTPGCVC